MHGTRETMMSSPRKHAEGLVPDQRPGAEDGVAQPERLLLAHVGHRRQLGDRLDLGELFQLAPVLEVVLELEGRVEVILDGPLVAPGHEDDLREPGGHGFLDHVLDRRRVHQGQHFLRLGLGGGEEPGPEPGGGEHGLLHTGHGEVRS